MITLLTILGLYLGGMICFALWDAHIGFGVEFDGGVWPPVVLAYAVWPITLACTMVAGLGRSLSSVKEKRIKKAEQQKRIRVAAEKEQEALLEQIEREMMEDESVSTTRSRRSKRS